MIYIYIQSSLILYTSSIELTLKPCVYNSNKISILFSSSLTDSFKFLQPDFPLKLWQYKWTCVYSPIKLRYWKIRQFKDWLRPLDKAKHLYSAYCDYLCLMDQNNYLLWLKNENVCDLPKRPLSRRLRFYHAVIEVRSG